jgi:hypothetical protein
VPVDVTVLDNDRDPDGDTLSVEVLSQPAGGSAQVLGNGRVRVTPATGYSGQLSFQYQAVDRRGERTAATTVTVVVEPTARALLAFYDAHLGFRWVVADTVESQVLDEGACIRPFPQVSPDGTLIIALRCAADGRYDLVALRSLETPLPAARTLLRDAPLSTNTPIIAADSGSVVVVQRVPDASDPGLTAAFELLRVDAATGSVTRRLRIDGIDRLYELRSPAASRLVYLLAHNPRGASGEDTVLMLADLDSATVRTVSVPGATTPLFFESAPLSDDGRFFVVSTAGDGITGYDTAKPGELVTFVPSGATRVPLGFVSATDTLIFRGYGPSDLHYVSGAALASGTAT